MAKNATRRGVSRDSADVNRNRTRLRSSFSVPLSTKGSINFGSDRCLGPAPVVAMLNKITLVNNGHMPGARDCVCVYVWPGGVHV